MQPGRATGSVWVRPNPPRLAGFERHDEPRRGDVIQLAHIHLIDRQSRVRVTH